jgi:hypothetical protein
MKLLIWIAALMFPIGLGCWFYFDNGWFALLSVLSLIFFMAG